MDSGAHEKRQSFLEICVAFFLSTPLNKIMSQVPPPQPAIIRAYMKIQYRSVEVQAFGDAKTMHWNSLRAEEDKGGDSLIHCIPSKNECTTYVTLDMQYLAVHFADR